MYVYISYNIEFFMRKYFRFLIFVKQMNTVLAFEQQNSGNYFELIF